MRSLYDAMSVGRASWSLIANNVITTNTFLLLTIIEGAWSIFYAVLMQQTMLEQLKKDIDFQGSAPLISIPMSFITKYQTIMSDNLKAVMVISFTLFGFYLLLFLLLSRSLVKDLGKSSLYHKIVGCLFMIFSKGLYLPMLEFTIRGYKAYQEYDLGVNIGLAVLNSISLLLYLTIMFFCRRIFKLCMLSEEVPWSGSNSKAIYFGVFAKVLNPVILAVDTTGYYIYAEIIVSAIVQSLYLAMSIFFADIYQKKPDLLQKFFQGLVVLIQLIGVVKYLIKDYDNKEYILFLCIFLFFLYFVYKVNHWRKERLLELFNQGHLKLELEFEYLLLYLQELVKEAMVDSVQSQEYYSEILKLIELHQLKCFDNDCMCNRQEDFIDILKQSQRQNANIFMIDKLKLKKIRHYISAKANMWISYTITRLKENSQQEKYARREKEEASLIVDDDYESSHYSRSERSKSHQDPHDLIHQDIPAGAGFPGLGLGNASLADGAASLNTNQRHRKNKKVKIDASFVKRRFITNFILLFFNDVKSKFPNSIKIHLLCNYYCMYIVGRPNLAIAQLRQFTEKNLSYLDRISKYCNEFFILHEYERLQKQNAIDIQTIRLDGEHFININDLYEQFHHQIDQLSNEGQQFWKGFTNEDVDPYKQYEYGEKIAESIRRTYQTFKKIEDTLIQKDFKIYVWFAQIQLKIMNDLDGYQIFIQKMRSVMQMNKMFSGAASALLKGKLMSEESGFLVVDGHTSSMGKILFMNKTLRRNLQRELDELKFMNISSMMPKLVAEKHDEFMRRYNSSGEAILLDKEMVTFLADKSMQLFPVDLLIKFHYSQKFQYSFIAFSRNLRTMTPFRDSLKYKTDQLIFLTIDMFDGQIYEVSKNFLHLLELAGISQFKDSLEIVFQEKKRTISDILRGFSFQDLLQLKKVRGNQRDFYEGMHQLDLSSFAETFDYFNQSLEDMTAKVAIYVDSYGQGKLDIGYVVLQIVTNATSSTLNLDDKSDDFQFKDQQQIYEDQMNQQIIDQESATGSESGSGSVSSGSSGTSTSYHAMQQFHSFYRQETPRILKIVIQLIVFMFVVSITIATVNLVLNIKSHNTSELEVRQVRASMDRLNFSVSIRVLMRSLLNIANGYEPNQSSIIQDRYSTYLSLLSDKSNQMISTQYYLDNSGYSFSKNFSEELAASQIQLTYLQDNGKLKIENVTMRNMMSLYTSRLVQVQEFTRGQMKGNLFLQSLKPNISTSYQPSIYEQTIFFIIFNGSTVVRQFNKMFADMYIRDSIANSESSEQQTLITTVVSILTIFLVTCVISPIVSKTEERKYNALVFFLKIPKSEVEFYIKNCQECEKLDGAKINSKNTYAVSNKPAQEVQDFQSLDYASMMYNDDLINEPSGSELRLHQENSILDTSQKRLMGSELNSSLRSGIPGSPSPLHLTQKKSLFQVNQPTSFMIHSMVNGDAIQFKSSSSKLPLSKGLSHKNSMSMIQEDIKNQEEQAREIQKISLQNKMLRGKVIESGFGKNGKSLSRSDSKSSKHSSSLPSLNNIFNKRSPIPQQQLKDIEMKSEDEKLQEIMNQILERNLKKITSIAFRKKTVTFLLVMILMIVFSVYFIISYFMSVQNYQAASNSSQDLGIIFSKEQCFENLISYIRENQISNTTLKLESENDVSASSFYLAQCSQQEFKFKNLRINMPEYFQGAQNYISSIETDQYCDVVFQKENTYKDAPCKAALNGLLQKGMTNTLFFMLAQAQKMELSFNTAIALNGRNLQFLTQIIGSKDTIELIDAKMYIMGQSFVELENQCMNSALSYFKKLLTDFVVVYAVFLVLLITSMIYFTIFAFNRLRKSMWSTNMLLKIIPKHTQTKEDQDRLKQFFVT